MTRVVFKVGFSYNSLSWCIMKAKFNINLVEKAIVTENYGTFYKFIYNGKKLNRNELLMLLNEKNSTSLTKNILIKFKIFCGYKKTPQNFWGVVV